MTHFHSYDDLIGYMDRLGLFHMDLTLGRMEAFWGARSKGDVPVVHVVGTNGKGSTSSFLCSVARAHGLKVGLFTSPHFLSPRERVQINRMPLSRDRWVELGNEIMNMSGGDALTYFEFQTSLAMLAFEQEGVDIAVMEAGLGGAYDATNIFEPQLTLYTPIGMDHEKVLGPTLADIARDKAGAMRSGGVALTGPQEDEVLALLKERAGEVGARLLHAQDLAEAVDGMRLGLGGIHQTANARLALAGWRWFAAGHDLRSDPISEKFGLESAVLPGRMQHVEIDGQAVILDGAHNVHALEALKAALDADAIEPGCVVFACLADKDISPMAKIVRQLGSGPILVPVMGNERALAAPELAVALGDRARPVASMAEALGEGKKEDGPLLICGSLYLLAEFYTVYPRFLTL